MSDWDKIPPAMKRFHLSAEKISKESLPPWRRISGFFQPDVEYDPEYRIESIARRIRYVYVMIRSELAREPPLTRSWTVTG